MPEITLRFWGLSHGDVKTVVDVYVLFHFMQSLTTLQRLLGPLAVMLHAIAACGPSAMGDSPSRTPCPDGWEKEHWETRIIAKLEHRVGHFETE